MKYVIIIVVIAMIMYIVVTSQTEISTQDVLLNNYNQVNTSIID